MKIGILQFNPHLGNPEYNSAKLEQQYANAILQGATIVLTPEIATVGYIPNDLLWDPVLRQRASDASHRLAERTGDVPLLLGTVSPAPSGRLWNEVWWCQHGKVLHRIRKRCLPTYDVFDEHRWFESDPNPQPLIPFDGELIGISICEDLWANPWGSRDVTYTINPIQDLVSAGATLLFNASVSPSNLGSWTSSLATTKRFQVPSKMSRRASLLLDQSRHYGVPIVFSSQVGAEGQLICDGGSGLADQHGRWQGAEPFEERVVLVDTAKSASAWEEPDSEEWLHKALVVGIKNNLFKQNLEAVVIGMSGGLDSAVVASLAANALGPDRVLAVSMPSLFTSSESTALAKEQADALGIHFKELPIVEILDSVSQTLESAVGPLGQLTSENIQSRARSQILMSLTSEKTIHDLLNTSRVCVLNTGNKSEAAVGYCTLYGDAIGAFSPLGDCLKSRVKALAMLPDLKIIPSIIERKPTAELRPNQTDEDSLMPYETLDSILSLHLECGLDFARVREEILKDTAPNDTWGEAIQKVGQLLAASEFKRKQLPYALKVSPKAFGSGRQIPLTSLNRS